MSKAKGATNGAAAGAEKKYNVDDIVLCKIKGFPSWPGQVVDESGLPPAVKRERPPKGFRVPVQFFPAGDYTWATSRDISLLTADDIDKYLADGSKKIGGDLRIAYQTAKSPDDWRNQQVENAKLREEEKKAAAEAKAMAEEDELASDAEAGSKKRKRKEAKPKETKEESKKKKKAKLNDLAAKRKSADANVESEDDGDAPASSAKTAAKPARKTNLDESADEGAKQAMQWRSKLQKCFFGKNTTPSDSEMPGIDEIFTAMEKYDMKSEWLTQSKLYKVLKQLLRDDTKIPREAEFNFRDRSKALLSKWNLGTTNGSGKDPEKEDATTETKTEATNGDAPAEDAQTADGEKKDEDVAMEE